MNMSKTKFHTLTGFIFLLGSLTLPDTTQAQIASWSFGGNANSSAGPGITATSTLGAGVTQQAFGTHYGSSGCSGRIIKNWNGSTTSISSAVSGNKYIEFAISPTGQDLHINSFQFSMSGGFTTNGTGSGAAMALRVSKNNFSSYTWFRNPTCNGAEYLQYVNPSNNGGCVTYSFSSSNTGSCSNPWPFVVNAGETIRFRIYIASTYTADTWRVSFRDISINGVTSLPVELTTFGAACEKGIGTRLQWTTASERNSDKFIVEKSRDLENWLPVSEHAAAGNSTQEIGYEAIDPAPFGGISYYRLIQKDLDGASRTYDPVSVSCEENGDMIQVYPNPAEGAFTAEISSSRSVSGAEVFLADATGKIIDVRSINLLEGVNQVLFDTDHLAKGAYIVHVASESNFKPVKLIVR